MKESYGEGIANHTSLESCGNCSNVVAGVDEMTWHKYKKGLAERTADLHERLHAGSYRAQPVRRSYISKADGRKR